jgi:pyruvate-ferredoxin/flavodoxin oxidoreductase
VEQTLEVPLTIADWACTEARFKQHFKDLPREEWESAIPFADFVKLPKADRADKTAYIYAVGKGRRLGRLRVSLEMATLAEERLQYWSQLRQLAGLEVSDVARNVVSGEIEAEFEIKMTALRAEFDARVAELKRDYPQRIARRLAEGLMKHGSGGALADLLATLPPAANSGNGAEPSVARAVAAVTVAPVTAPAAPAALANAAPTAAAVATPAPAAAATADEDESLALEAYIDSARCTSCNECTNLNKKMFAYNAAKQAEVKDASAGTFQQLVLAAERCPVSIIHPGSPLNPKEKDLEKWVKRAARFN